MRIRCSHIAGAVLLATGLRAQAPALPRALIDRVPSVATTSHTGVFGGETVRYAAIVEEHILKGPDSIPNASLVTIAYVRTGVGDPARRPVMFVFNGGPGASSSPLHMNGIGPRLTAGTGTVANPHSILDATDLVFIDPVGTGFSRPYTTEAGKQFYWSRTGDATSVNRVIDRWLATHGRTQSPRFIAGESYGAMRVGLIYKTSPNAMFDGILLVAVVGDGDNAGREMPYVTALPTMATSAWFWSRIDRRGRTVQQVYGEAVRFARTEYLTALVQGWSLPAAERARVARRMAALIGLPASFIEARNLRVSKDDWMLNILKDRNLRTGMLDTRVTSTRDTTRTGGLSDPALGGGTMRIGTAMLAPAMVPGAEPPAAAPGSPPRTVSALERYLKEDLEFPTPEAYRSLNLDINGVWNHEDGAETNAFIAAAMRANPRTRLFWTAGYYDLTTPAYGTQYSLDQVGVPAERTTAAIVPGPHGVFADSANRALLVARLRRWIAAGSTATGGAAATQRGRTEMHVTVRPMRAGAAEVSTVAVRQEIRGALPTATAFSVRAPITYASVRNIADRVDSLVVTDARGRVPVRAEDDPVDQGGFPYYRHWRATRRVVPPVVVRYRMRPFPGVPSPGPQFDFYAHGGGISAGGMALFLIPEGIDTATIRVQWDLADLAPGSIAASTYGEGDFRTREPPAELLQAYYMAGPLGRYAATADTAGFHGYWLGQPQFDPRREMAWTLRAYDYLRGFYRDSTTASYRVFLRAIPGAERSLGGTALRTSFMVGTPAGTPDTTKTSARNTIAHEMGHMWVGSLASDDETGGTWFTEGLNVYYTRLLLLRSGLSPVSDYERDINASARGYYSSPYRTASADSIARLGFSTGIGAGSAQNLPYVRGSLYFADLDARIREASGGQRKLDDVLMPLFARRRRGERIDQEAFVAALVRELGPAERARFESTILRGELLEPVSNAFGPCFERRATTYTVSGRASAGFEWVRVPSLADERCREW